MHAAMPCDEIADATPWASAVLDWTARLPLVPEGRIAALLGIDEWSARDAVRELRRQGLLTTVTVDSPEWRESRRLCSLTSAGVQAYSRRIGMTAGYLGTHLPVDHREILVRLVRVETAVAVCDFIAELAARCRRPGGDRDSVVLDDAWATHWRGPAAVEALLRLRAGDARLTCALVWDRAGVPAAHRRARVAGWYRIDEGSTVDLDRSAMPPVLVACPDERAARMWEAAVEASAARRGITMLPVLIATATDVAALGPLGACWRMPGRSIRASLCERLPWHRRVAPATSSSSPRATVPPTALDPEPSISTDGSLQQWAAVVVRATATFARLAPLEQHAALTVVLSASQKALLGWVARHPLLPAEHLAVHAGLSLCAVQALLADLLRLALLRSDTGFSIGVGEPVTARYVLAPPGARYLAAREGVPPRRFLREGTIAVDRETAAAQPSAFDPSAAIVRLADLHRHPQHTIGVQQLALALAGEAAAWRRRGVDHQVVSWDNAAEAEERFRFRGKFWAIRPDARFRYRISGTEYDVMLEWDRGVVRRRDYLRKFAAYAAYFGRGAASQFDQQRVIVVTKPAAENRVREAVHAVAAGCRALDRFLIIVTTDAVRAHGIVSHLRLGRGEGGSR